MLRNFFKRAKEMFGRDSEASTAEPVVDTAIADDADFSGRGDGVGGTSNIGDDIIETQFRDQRATAGNACAVVVEFHVVFDVVEERRCDRAIPRSSEAFDQGTDVRIDAEYFLHDHETAAARPGRHRPIGANAVHVAARYAQHFSHVARHPPAWVGLRRDLACKKIRSATSHGYPGDDSRIPCRRGALAVIA